MLYIKNTPGEKFLKSPNLYTTICSTSSTDTSNNTDVLFVNDIIDEKNKSFGIDNIPIENNRLPNMCWMPKTYINLKARFFIQSPKSSIKPLARTISSIFVFFIQIQNI